MLKLPIRTLQCPSSRAALLISHCRPTILWPRSIKSQHLHQLRRPSHLQPREVIATAPSLSFSFSTMSPSAAASSSSSSTTTASATSPSRLAGQKEKRGDTPSTASPSSKRTRVEASSPKKTKATTATEDPFEGGLDEEALIAAAEAFEEDVSAATNVVPKKPSTAPAPATAKTTPAKPAPAPSKPLTDPTSQDPLALERRTMDPAWFSALESEMRKPYFLQLKAFLAEEKKNRQTVYPPEELIHSWSRLTPLHKVKVVVVGQDPYHGPGQACGMSFSVPPSVPVPASLRNIYKELSTEYPSQFVAPKHGNLESWAKQGVLLLNASLTVRAHQAASHHGKGWEQFTQTILRLIADEAAKGSGGRGAGTEPVTGSTAAVKTSTGGKQANLLGMFAKQKKSTGDPASDSKVSSQTTNPSSSQTTMENGETKEKTLTATSSSNKGVVFLSWGLPSSRTLSSAGITSTSSPSKNILLLSSAHPSPLSASRGFLGNGHFKRANDWLQDEARYGPQGGIRWWDL